MPGPPRRSAADRWQALRKGQASRKGRRRRLRQPAAPRAFPGGRRPSPCCAASWPSSVPAARRGRRTSARPGWRTWTGSRGRSRASCSTAAPSSRASWRAPTRRCCGATWGRSRGSPRRSTLTPRSGCPSRRSSGRRRCATRSTWRRGRWTRTARPRTRSGCATRWGTESRCPREASSRRACTQRSTRDREAIRALSAPDIVVDPTVEAYRGTEGVLAWMDEGDDAFDDFIVELLGVEELGKQVVVSIRQRGRATRLQSFADREDAVRYARTGGEHERRVAKARPSWILALYGPLGRTVATRNRRFLPDSGGVYINRPEICRSLGLDRRTTNRGGKRDHPQSDQPLAFLN